MRTIDELDLTALPPAAVLGRHAVWLPPRAGEDMGVKVPFQFGGLVQKYAHPDEGSYPRSLIADEVALLRELAARRWVPPTGDWVYFETVISEHPGGWWADPCGAIGYEMADARQLAPGDFSVDALRASGLVAGSPGAWGDLPKPGNVVNGYLVDAARSGHDRLRLADPPAGSTVDLPDIREDADALWADVLAAGAFPFKARPEPYQDVWLRGAWRRGERRVPERALALGFTPSPGDVVLDIGCQLGGFLQYAALRLQGAKRGAARLIGVDAEPEYIALARHLARSAGMNICYRTADIEADWNDILSWLRRICLPVLHHCLLLSLGKHFKRKEETVWRIVDDLCSRQTYLETNAVSVDSAPDRLTAGVLERGGRLIGYTHDRNTRRIYRI